MAKKTDSGPDTKKTVKSGGKTKRAVIKDLQPTARDGQKIIGGTTRLGTRCV